MLKVLLIGEAAPDGVEPMKGDAGRRMARYADVTHQEFLATFDVVNVLNVWPGRGEGGDLWPEDAAETAMRSLWQEVHRDRVVLLGGRVRGVHPVPDVKSADFFEWVSVDHCRVATVPHPSGRNRWYNDVVNRELAKTFMRDLVELGRMCRMAR